MEHIFDPRISPGMRQTIESFTQSMAKPLGNGFVRWHSLEVEHLSDQQGLRIWALLSVDGKDRMLEWADTEIADPRYSPDDWSRRKREMVRKLVLEAFQTTLPWGILTGIRPTKLYHRLKGRGFSAEEVVNKLQTVYGVSPEKARLLTEVGEAQYPFIQPDPNRIGIYVGIPFCPTRCRYCSFASHPLHSHGHHVAGFVQALIDEIRYFAGFCREMGWKAGALYVGGGTPTALSAHDLDLILRELVLVPRRETLEFTVEAGRPETITNDHLKVFQQWGVNRTSVNPQTMHDKTLQRIGRLHTVRDVREGVERVRRAGIPVLNMDLIAGLPGETAEDMDFSLQEVLGLSPENVTIHTLAPKRAAEWRLDKIVDHLNEDQLAAWLDSAGTAIRTGGWLPYYLYRQRRIMANQENVGYAPPGFESVYNIWIMEECRTILGLGGGAVTKWVDSQTGFIARRSNPKCPATFTQRSPGEKLEKAKWLRGYLN